MSTVRVDLKDAAAYFAGPLRDEIIAAGRRGLLSAAMRAVNVIQTQIIPSRVPQPVDRGIYRAGWKFEATPDGAVFYNNEPHAPFIEYGVRAERVKIGRKMIDALTEWALRKGAADRDQAKSVAWAIAKAAQKKGIFNRNGPGLGILTEMTDRYIDNIVRDEVVAELRRI